VRGISSGTIVGVVITLIVLLGLAWLYSYFTETTKETTDIEGLK
jgi:hypothetical protein